MVKAVSEFYKKNMSRSGHMVDYLPGGEKPGRGMRFPSPGSQPDPAVPTGLKTHKYKTTYYNREGISPAPIKPNVPQISPADSKLLLDGEKEIPERFRVAPAHVPRPWWWYEQDEIIAECEKKGYYTPGKSDWGRWTKDYEVGPVILYSTKVDDK